MLPSVTCARPHDILDRLDQAGLVNLADLVTRTPLPGSASRTRNPRTGL